MTRYVCKSCGAESPAGIGYACTIAGPLPEPSADCDWLHYGVTRTWHDANGFPHILPYAVPFTLEESDVWICTACDEECHGDVDSNGHSYDGETAEQIWTACPIEANGDGDVWSGSFADALRFFTDSFAAGAR